MLQPIYYLIIYPIELLLEAVFSVLNKVWDDPGMAIIGVSIAVNLLMLPLYKRADSISDHERRQQEIMKPWISHIRRVFHGDERFMMLQTYYRKQGYRPLYSLRSSLPLILEIPFFIAAYHFLSHLSLLNGTVFGWIRDLGRPDSIIMVPAIGLNIYTENHVMQDITLITASGETVFPSLVLLRGFHVNLLPLIMTLINIISVKVYTIGSPLKEKIQLYVMAILFLALLYKSPSGLVIYWTMNNIFSLVKNIIMQLKRKLRLSEKTVKDSNMDARILPGAILLSILTGVVIPSSVIVSSPSEFIMVMDYKDPLQYVVSTTLIASGVFLIWLPVFYYLSSAWAKRVICILLWVLSWVSLLDFLMFGKVDAYISSELRYDSEFVLSMHRIVLNLVILITMTVIISFIMIKKAEWVKPIYTAVIAGLVILSGINLIQTEIRLSYEMENMKKAAEPFEGFKLSQNGKNVVVLMLDRAMGLYIPFIMAERPELMEKFSGFTYYPNTVSFGGCTAIGGPPLFGGYEYTPEESDRRSDMKLVDKHDESLKVMPVLFSENGYNTTVYDPPYAGYEPEGDLSIYEEYPNIKAYSLKQRFVDPEILSFVNKYRVRSFFMYSIFKSVPSVLQPYVYDEGDYNYPDILTFPDMDFMSNFSILENMIDLTVIEHDYQNTFMMMDNDTTHDPCELQLPDYTVSGYVNNSGLDTGTRTDADGNSMDIDYYRHYHANIAALIQIGKWLDFLKEKQVYDNTRIIIVSDHAYTEKQFDNLILEDGTDLQAYIPLLMYKDFNADEYSVDDTFMTNADTPFLATNGLFENNVNPFTGNTIDCSAKTSHDQMILCTDEFEGGKEQTVFYKPGQKWYAVHDNVFDRRNWTRVDMD